MQKIRFTTCSQREAELLDNNSCCIRNFTKPVMISITSPLEDRANIEVKIPILRLQFDDIDKDDISKITTLPLQPFTKGDAMKIFDFIEFEKPDMIITHCKAGVCRSAAVNAALSKIILGKDDRFFQEKVPNMLVYTTMLNYWFVDLLQCSEIHKEMSAKHIHPWIYKMRVKHFKRIH